MTDTAKASTQRVFQDVGRIKAHEFFAFVDAWRRMPKSARKVLGAALFHGESSMRLWENRSREVGSPNADDYGVAADEMSALLQATED